MRACVWCSQAFEWKITRKFSMLAPLSSFFFIPFWVFDYDLESLTYKSFKRSSVMFQPYTVMSVSQEHQAT